jgi:hypothetical protein
MLMAMPTATRQSNSQPATAQIVLGSWNLQSQAIGHQFHSQLRERRGGAIVPNHVLNYFRRDYEAFLL